MRLAGSSLGCQGTLGGMRYAILRMAVVRERGPRREADCKVRADCNPAMCKSERWVVDVL